MHTKVLVMAMYAEDAELMLQFYTGNGQHYYQRCICGDREDCLYCHGTGYVFRQGNDHKEFDRWVEMEEVFCSYEDIIKTSALLHFSGTWIARGEWDDHDWYTYILKAYMAQSCFKLFMVTIL